MTRRQQGVWSILGGVALLGVWWIFSRRLGSDLVLPSPELVARRLATLIATRPFWLAVAGSLWRVLVALLVSIPLAVLCGLATASSPRFRALLSPAFAVISATPVLSVILIAVLVFGQEGTPVFSAFLMLFPVMATAVNEGVASIDLRLREMAAIYHLSRAQRFWHLYVPSLAPFLASGLRTSLSLAWKVVVAAEVIAQPLRSLGASMQNAKAQLETAELFAFTAATVLLAAASEALIPLARRAYRKLRSRHAT